MFQKFKGHIPFLTKGPLATYLGDAEVEVAREHTDPLNYYNTGLLVLLLPIWTLFAIYKKIRFTGRTDYVQKLHQVILGVGGRENVSRKMIILGQWLLCLSFFAGHFFASWSLKNRKKDEDPVQIALKGNIFVGFMCTCCCCYPLLGNRALRYNFS